MSQERNHSVIPKIEKKEKLSARAKTLMNWLRNGNQLYHIPSGRIVWDTLKPTPDTNRIKKYPDEYERYNVWNEK